MCILYYALHLIRSLSMTCDRLMIYSGYSTNKTYSHDITEILLKVALNTINHKPIREVTDDSTNVNALHFDFEGVKNYIPYQEYSRNASCALNKICTF